MHINTIAKYLFNVRRFMVMFRLSAKGTDGVMKPGGHFASQICLLYSSCRPQHTLIRPSPKHRRARRDRAEVRHRQAQLHAGLHRDQASGDQRNPHSHHCALHESAEEAPAYFMRVSGIRTLFPLDGVFLVSAIWCASCYLEATIFIPIIRIFSSFHRIFGQNLVRTKGRNKALRIRAFLKSRFTISRFEEALPSGPGLSTDAVL